MTLRAGTMQLACMFSSILLFGAAGLLLFISLQDSTELSPRQVPGVKFNIRLQQPHNVSAKSQINLSTGSLGKVGEGREENLELTLNPFLERKMRPVLPTSLGNKDRGCGPVNFLFGVR
ncbi:carbohydrate sulfotransferase 8 [Phyllostomus discolor]|uniref:Carbohydrate sulfotransferase 8 n=1 Tax=Phyllostomus discolor TaxID=89673 RepID=A0A833YQ80_9CHIR|nr:carbohydrate sulfotransferase 8 [Phyllostomus discolor]